MNEIITLLTIYHLFCFTDFVADSQAKTLVVGNSMMLITLFNLIINIGPILPGLARQSRRRVRNQFLWVKGKKAI